MIESDKEEEKKRHKTPIFTNRNNTYSEKKLKNKVI